MLPNSNNLEPHISNGNILPIRNILEQWLIILQSNPEFEFEIRFKSFRTDAFRQGIPYKDYDRLKQHFQSNPTESSILRDQSQSVNYFDPTRKVQVRSTIRKTSRPEETDIWIRKTNMRSDRDKVYHLRYVFSHELPLTEPYANFKPETTRIKNRTSYRLNKWCRLDLTEVTMVEHTIMSEPTTYEVELEVLYPPDSRENPSDIFEILEQTIRDVFLVLHETENVYTAQEYKNLVRYFNSTLQLKSKDEYTLSRWGLFQPRNLHFNDLVMGGIIGNPTYSYSCTIKADGQRKLLVVSPTGIWLVMSENDANLVIRFGVEPPDNFKERLGYILECEYIPENSRKLGAPTQKYWCLVYDCLAVPSSDVLKTPYSTGMIGIQQKPHAERLRHSQRLVDFFKENSLLLLSTKQFQGFSSAYQMFAIIRQLEFEGPNRPYKNDGYIFTAEEMPYDLEVNLNERLPHKKPDYRKVWDLPLYKRVLTQYPDICKWKPSQELTIDFSIEPITRSDGQTNIRLYSGLPGNRLELFTGTNNIPFSLDQVEPPMEGSIINGLPIGTIVEYKWDYQQEMMIPIRVRNDKHRPNVKMVAEDTWKMIHDPILLSTLTEEDFRLMRKYHNRIKLDLFRSAVTSLKQGSKKLTALDIGSGPGGDTAKLRDFDQVIFLEPNTDYLNELSNRIKGVFGQEKVTIISQQDHNRTIDTQIQLSHQEQDKAIILNTGGEDFKLIRRVVNLWIGGPVSLISIMLSMSFFWSSPEMVQKLNTTILENLASDGEGIFFTIDGQLVEHTFNPIQMTNGRRIGGNKKPDNKMILGKAKLNYTATESKLIIDIPGTLVIDQTEYPPYLIDLEMGLSPKFKITNLGQADQELMLNSGEHGLTKLYMAGRIRPIDSPDERTIKYGIHRRMLKKMVKPDIKMCSPVRAKTTVRRSVRQPDRNPPKITEVARKPQDKPLVMMPIFYDYEKDLGIGDDALEIISSPWYINQPVVRIATIGDGSCFFHALLKAFYGPYANHNKYSDRVDLVKKLRRDLAAVLGEVDKKTGRTHYQMVGGGYLVDYSNQQQRGAILEFDPSLKGMQELLNSDRFVGQEVAPIISDMLGIDIYVMLATENSLYRMYDTHREGQAKAAVIIAGNGLHYETLGVKTEKGIQTIFRNYDPFIISLWKHINESAARRL